MVHYIYYSNGAKMMRPIMTREEYMRLRDSDENRRADKKHMVQMNYSCMPNDDGTLKGSTRKTDSVAMDADFKFPEGASEGIREAKLAEVEKMILDKKKELGLLMLERSATKGFHLVFKRREELSQEDNLKWASKLIGVEYDQSAKDITRVLYTPADKLVFLDEDIFRPIPRPLPKGRGVESGEINFPEVHETTPSVLGEDSGKGSSEDGNYCLPLGEEAGKGALRAFDLCVEHAGLKQEEMDVWGEHNWHSNLMAVLSTGLPKLMSREQLEAVVRERLPNYSQTKDCRALIEYFYEKYSADKGYMSSALRDINARAQQAFSNFPKGEDNDEDEREMAELMEGWKPPKMPKKLPRLVELEVRDFDPRYREALAMTAIVGHSGIASHFRATYLNGKIITPATMVSVIGASGSGKDNATQLFNIQMKETLDAWDNAEWEKVRVNSEMRDKMRNSKECPAKYHPKIRVFESASKTSLLELQTNLGENGMLVGLYSESDGFVGASGASWSNLSVIFRKGFAGEKHRQFYMSESTCNTNTPLNISVLMEGTPKVMLGRLFNESNCENGLVQRFVAALMPKKKRSFRPPKQNYLTGDERMERDALLKELFQKDLALGDSTLMLETPKMCNAIGEWFDSLEVRYNDGELTDAEADLSHRCGEFMLRAAIPLIALYGETKEVIEYGVWVGEMAFYNMCRIYGHRVQADIAESDALLAPRNDGRKTAEPLLTKLPDLFTLQQFKEVRVKAGQSAEVKMLLSRYCRGGKLEKVGKGVYRKK